MPAEMAHYDDGRYRVVVYRNSNTGRLALRIELPNGLSEHPIRYDDGRIAYDRPEAVPLKIRKMIASMYAGRCRV